MNFEARSIDVRANDGAVIAIGCDLNGRARRFTVDNVRDSKAAGHRFYVRDAGRTAVDVLVVGASDAARLQTSADSSQRNALSDLPDWVGDR